MKTPAESIGNMIGQVTELTWSVSLWWEFRNAEDFDKNSVVIKEPPNFFQALDKSLEQGFCIIAYRLFFDHKDDTESLRSLINESKKTNPTLSRKLESKIEGHGQILNKIKEIRHNVYGHLNKRRNQQTVYKAVKLTARQVKDIVKLAQETVTELAVNAGTHKQDFLEDTFRHCQKDILDEASAVMEILRKHFR